MKIGLRNCGCRFLCLHEVHKYKGFLTWLSIVKSRRAPSVFDFGGRGVYTGDIYIYIYIYIMFVSFQKLCYNIHHLKTDNFSFKNVENFNYLGSILSVDNIMNIEIAERIAEGIKAYYVNEKLIK
jgi:hypothetical protein